LHRPDTIHEYSCRSVVQPGAPRSHTVERTSG
jgi:hypothetical protein